MKLDLIDLHLVGRYHYSAVYNEEFGENEIDYCFLIKKNLEYKINEAEVSEAFYVDYKQLEDIYESSQNKISPWFNLFIKNGIVKDWFDNLDEYCSGQHSKELPEIFRL